MEVENELEASLGPEVAKATMRATKSVNRYRKRFNIPPIKIDVETTKKAQ